MIYIMIAGGAFFIGIVASVLYVLNAEFEEFY